jgi:hypothetical protein
MQLSKGIEAVVLVAMLGIAVSQCRQTRGTESCPANAGVLDMEPARSMMFDLDCDGGIDTLAVTTDPERGLLLSVSGSVAGAVQLTKPGEFIAITDFNGDGVLDVALQRFDESSVTADVLLIERDHVRLAPYAPSLRREAMYLFHDVGFSEGCIDAVRPRVRRTPAGESVLDVARGDYYEARDCAEVDRIELRVVDDTIRAR